MHRSVFLRRIFTYAYRKSDLVALFAGAVPAGQQLRNGRTPELTEHGVILRLASTLFQHLRGGGAHMDTVQHPHLRIIGEAAIHQADALPRLPIQAGGHVREKQRHGQTVQVEGHGRTANGVAHGQRAVLHKTAGLERFHAHPPQQQPLNAQQTGLRDRLRAALLAVVGEIDQQLRTRSLLRRRTIAGQIQVILMAQRHQIIPRRLGTGQREIPVRADAGMVGIHVIFRVVGPSRLFQIGGRRSSTQQNGRRALLRL